MPWLVYRLYVLRRWLLSRTKNLTSRPVRVGIFAFVAALLFHPAPAHATPLWVEDLAQGIAYYAFIIASALTQVIVLLIDAMVPIMTYNNFVDNPVVKAGWAIVRDTVNMFFVVILIIIAFGTIFGNERFKWQQQVPRLLTMAIVVNFSKTLCGIMIDFGQVIMLTFANALREIAAGNFIQLFGLNQIYSASASAGENASEAFDFFAAGLASVLMVMWVLATLVIMVAILLFRIIMLWILVVIAPLAWFMKGAEGIIKSNAYSEWWNEFKCLVGIGPILAFFLWLTLAVAGAGNIAAKSGFDVDADSNNAGFKSSILQVNNFLSFLIGMAMLFAGFKAAAEFCSGSIAGGKIQSMLKQPAALARTAAGLGLKAGVVGARLAGRGIMATPGAAMAASRYLPPVVRNIPSQINPLNAQRRARIAGAIGGALGDNAAGQFFKGKQSDLEQRIRVKRSEGVDKEREAMKDKDRPWKQRQLESKLRMKSPPTTQVGQDAMTALFEEVMKDPRLQKDLLANDPDAMKKLWASQGTKYEAMSKGNAAKTAYLEGFKKKYAHVTGAVDELDDADDMKGLAAGAWEDAAVQEKAGRTATTFKKDGKTLTALEAAREGHYGEDAQKAAIKGTDVTKLDIGKQMEDQFASALRGQDKGSAEKVLAHMESKYTDAATSNEDRAKMARSMDRMRAAADKMGKDGNGTANDLLPSFNTKRKGMETKSGFGLPPAPKIGESGKEYVDQNYGQASKDRMDRGVAHFKDQEADTNAAVSDLETELKNLETADKATNTAVAAKRQQIEQVRARIEQGSKAEIDAAYNDLRAARKLLEEAERGGDSSEIESGQEVVRETEASYTNAQTDAQNELSGDKELQSLEQEIQELMASSGSTRGEEVAKKSRQLAELKAEAKRVADVRKALEEESKKRA